MLKWWKHWVGKLKNNTLFDYQSWVSTYNLIQTSDLQFIFPQLKKECFTGQLKSSPGLSVDTDGLLMEHHHVSHMAGALWGCHTFSPLIQVCSLSTAAAIKRCKFNLTCCIGLTKWATSATTACHLIVVHKSSGAASCVIFCWKTIL